MHLVDWLIVALPLIVVTAIALYARRYVKSVADFMAGGRNAGRYLLCTARSEMGAGAVIYVASFEVFSKGGFSFRWWSNIGFLSLLVTISGFVIYRYRQTRALTLAQFFEMRYSRRFRLFTGALAFFAGLVNFGIMPVINARFIVYFLGLPHQILIFSHTVPTYVLVMGLFLTICTLMTTLGGQITVLVADCAEGMVSQIFYVIIAVAVLLAFSWSSTREVLLAQPPGRSLVNPFDSFSVNDFNIWYALMALAVGTYSTMAWQNSHAFNASGITPHESRMGGILGSWRSFAQSAMIVLLAVSALTYLSHADGAGSVQRALDGIPDAQTAKQMRIPVALSQILPIGIKGLFVSILLMGIFSGDGMHLHSWSSIFIQDIVLPLRKRPLSTRQHLILLRLAVVGVATCAFLFGTLFRQTEYVAIWFAVTQAIFTGGAGAAIIGGLYWSRGTTTGAWVGLLSGSILSVGGILLRQPACVTVLTTAARHLHLDSCNSYIAAHFGPAFPLNGMEISFYASLVAIGLYILISFLTCRHPHNMDRLLHRGLYCVEADKSAVSPPGSRWHLRSLVGIDEHFTRADRWITLGIFGWSVLWFAVFLVGSVWYLLHPWSDRTWANYWLIIAIYLPLLIGVVTTVWFTIGCWHDMRVFFGRLGEEKIDIRDDGTVTDEKTQDHQDACLSLTAEP